MITAQCHLRACEKEELETACSTTWTDNSQRTQDRQGKNPTVRKPPREEPGAATTHGAGANQQRKAQVFASFCLSVLVAFFN